MGFDALNGVGYQPRSQYQFLRSANGNAALAPLASVTISVVAPDNGIFTSVDAGITYRATTTDTVSISYLYNGNDVNFSRTQIANEWLKDLYQFGGLTGVPVKKGESLSISIFNLSASGTVNYKMNINAQFLQI